MKFVDDLAGAIYDILIWILWGFSYLAAGALIVGAPLYLIAFLLEWLS
ncbi:hypothetical protein [Planococcus maitriensis]|nr:hypothetical protein [Planococcus maitriensis]